MVNVSYPEFYLWYLHVCKINVSIENVYYYKVFVIIMPHFGTKIN